MLCGGCENGRSYTEICYALKLKAQILVCYDFRTQLDLELKTRTSHLFTQSCPVTTLVAFYLALSEAPTFGHLPVKLKKDPKHHSRRAKGISSSAANNKPRNILHFGQRRPKVSQPQESPSSQISTTFTSHPSHPKRQRWLRLSTDTFTPCQT